MANYTEHYQLIKPLQTENYNVDVANDNNTRIDQVLFQKMNTEDANNEFTQKTEFNTWKDIIEQYFETEYNQAQEKLKMGTVISYENEYLKINV